LVDKKRDWTNSLNVIITGSNGFIGSNLVKLLNKEKKFNVTCIVHTKSSNIKDQNVNIVNCDLLDENQVRKIIKDADVIIHLASLLQTSKNKEQIYIVNVKIMQNILDNCKNVKHLIFASTDFGLDPKASYSKSKKKCEELIKESNIPFTIFKIPPVLGFESTNSTSNLIRAINAGKLIPIPGDGNQIIQPVYIDDIIKAIEQVILDEKFFRKICAVAGEPIKINDFIDKVSQIVGKKKKGLHLPIGLLKLAAKTYQVTGSDPGFSPEQLDDLSQMTLNNVLKTDFQVSPIDFAIKKTLGI